MQMTRPMTVMELVQDTVLQHREGAKGVAEELGKSASTIYSEINPNDNESSTHKLGLMDWTRVLRKTGDLRSLHKINEVFGLVAVKIADHRPNTADARRDWLDHIAQISLETGETVAALADAIADGNVTDCEKQKCQKEAYEALQALAGLWTALNR